MTKITELDRKIVAKLVEELNEVMSTALEKYGLVVERKGGVSYGPTEFNIKFSVNVTNEGGENTRAKEVYELHAAANGLDCAFGRTLLMNGDERRVIGWNPKAPKYPIILEDVRTKTQYKTTIRSVKRAIESEEKN